MSYEDVSRMRADDHCAIGAQRNVLLVSKNFAKAGKLLTLTAVKLLRRAQINCGLTVTCRSRASFETSSRGFGRENVKTSPMDDRAAKVCPQLVTFSIIGLMVDWGGRNGKASDRIRGVENLPVSWASMSPGSLTHVMRKFVSWWKQTTSYESNKQIIA